MNDPWFFCQDYDIDVPKSNGNKFTMYIDYYFFKMNIPILTAFATPDIMHSQFDIM